MKKIMVLMLAVAFITLLCAPLVFGKSTTVGNPSNTVNDNTVVGDPAGSGGDETGSGYTDMNTGNNTVPLNGGFNGNGSSGNAPGTNLFGTFPNSGN
jgi:hypothetical protein